MNTHLGKRIQVVGTTGSGKTTLARQIAAKLAYPHTELDSLWWQENWTNPSVEEFRQRVEQTTDRANWVLDGNYGHTQDIIWGRADTIIWIDFPLGLILFRLVRRTLSRLIRQEELWNGNRERFTTTFLSRESLFIWIFQSYWRNKRRYFDLLAQAENSHLQSIHLKSSKEVQKLVDSLD